MEVPYNGKLHFKKVVGVNEFGALATNPRTVSCKLQKL